MELKQLLAMAVNDGGDLAAERLRVAVGQTLATRQATESMVMAMAAEQGEDHRRTMRTAVHDAGQFFDRGDRNLALVAMPVGTLMQTPYTGVCQMSTGVESKLKEAGRALRAMTGSERVVMDGRLYSVNALRSATVAELSHYADEMEDAAAIAQPLGEAATLRSSQSPSWQLTYFLALCVVPKSQQFCLRSKFVIDRLQPSRELLGEAISEHMELVDNEVMEFETDAYGFFYLRDGIRGGLNGFRGARLRNFLEQMNLAVMRTDATFAVDTDRSVVRLLLVNGRERIEFVWPMEEGEEARTSFLPALTSALSEIDVGAMTANELPFDEYAREVRKAGLVWVRSGQTLAS